MPAWTLDHAIAGGSGGAASFRWDKCLVLLNDRSCMDCPDLELLLGPQTDILVCVLKLVAARFKGWTAVARTL